MTASTRLRIVHACDFCGRQRNPEDLTRSNLTHWNLCNNDLVTCVNIGMNHRKREKAIRAQQRGQTGSVKV